MKIALLGSGLFLAGFLAHWLVWRVRVPARANASLLAVFSGVLAAGLAAVRLVPPLRPLSPGNAWEVLHVVLFHVSMTLGYIVTYSGLEEDSPSTTMVKYVALAGDDGRVRADFDRIITNDLIVESRLRAMVRSGMATQDSGRFRLTPQGLFWHRIFSSWTRLLGIPRGG